jgi:hypothetical protein
MNLWERGWSINAGPADVFLGGGKTTTFELKKSGENGATHFEVIFKREEMPAEWNDCSLVARGTEPFKLIGDPLPEFDESEATKTKYNEAINKALANATSSTRRLEGELDDGLGRKSVFLFLARGAVGVKDKTGVVTMNDLLVLKRATRLPWSTVSGAGPIDDGTAHGTRK